MEKRRFILSHWLAAARPRTLLLSLSGILMGGGLAWAEHPDASPWTIIFCALTAVTLQILSNLANDYGDYEKGVDNARRTGPRRTLQSGALTPRQMRVGMAVTAALALLFGALLIGVFAQLSWCEQVVFALLGLAALAAALLYTLGKHPYGYHGLGDLFCFLFFGWVAVAGTWYLATAPLAVTNSFAILLPAMAMGCLSTAVLNINNLRDYENDKASGKHTLVVKMGLKNAFIYHVFLLVIPFLCMTIFLILRRSPYYTYAFWFLFPLFFKDLLLIHKTLTKGVSDSLLPRQVFHTFLFSIVFITLYLL